MKSVLVVGSGLAGMAMAQRLMVRGVAVTVVAEPQKMAGTRVATGMYNPIVFRRVAKSWRVDDLLPAMHEFQAAIETMLGSTFSSSLCFKRRMPSVDYQQLWDKRAQEADFALYVKPASGGFGAVMQAGIVQCAALMDAFEAHLTARGRLVKERFDHSSLELGQPLVYKGTAYDAVVFCEGAHAVENPFFSWLPFNICKGEWVVVETDKPLTDTCTINNGVNIIPMGANRYKLSSTYAWNNLDWQPTQAAADEMLAAFREVHDGRCEIVERAAGLRPTVADRRPYLGSHPRHKNLYIFNGLGSKGVMLAPYFSKHLVEHILDGTPLMSEVDIARHGKRLPI